MPEEYQELFAVGDRVVWKGEDRFSSERDRNTLRSLKETVGDNQSFEVTKVGRSGSKQHPQKVYIKNEKGEEYPLTGKWITYLRH